LLSLKKPKLTPLQPFSHPPPPFPPHPPTNFIIQQGSTAQGTFHVVLLMFVGGISCVAAPAMQDPLPLGDLRAPGVPGQSLPREALRGHHHQDLFRDQQPNGQV
jgi:hypothetical protein